MIFSLPLTGISANQPFAGSPFISLTNISFYILPSCLSFTFQLFFHHIIRAKKRDYTEIGSIPLHDYVCSRQFVCASVYKCSPNEIHTITKPQNTYWINTFPLSVNSILTDWIAFEFRIHRWRCGTGMGIQCSRITGSSKFPLKVELVTNEFGTTSDLRALNVHACCKVKKRTL